MLGRWSIGDFRPPTVNTAIKMATPEGGELVYILDVAPQDVLAEFDRVAKRGVCCSTTVEPNSFGRYGRVRSARSRSRGERRGSIPSRAWTVAACELGEAQGCLGRSLAVLGGVGGLTQPSGDGLPTIGDVTAEAPLLPTAPKVQARA
jgi:hypothetical protein